ncbi:DUF4249 domain-containing protein [Pseudopedobacter beijingensis]|uniref:DUF4249 domain-containing protein n=1 Tax=Pseudopedobacter beijingensis TaxID=1207056 RepID=A0ABW4I6E6_9SPHI
MKLIYAVKNIGFIAVLTLLLSSCEEVIDIDVNQNQPKLVIEGNVTDELGKQFVKISETVPFKNESAIKEISGATVMIQEENGQLYHLTEESNGLYSASFKGLSGKKYYLAVTINDKTYQASCVMPEKVVLDSISVTQVSMFDEKRNFLKLHYQDPPEEGNAYRYIIKNNGVPYKGFFVSNDKFDNGRYVNRTVYTDDPKIEVDDNIDVEFLCISPEVYKYFYSLVQITGGGGPPVSAGNPVSNISGDALGYFSAHTIQRNSFQVK